MIKNAVGTSHTRGTGLYTTSAGNQGQNFGGAGNMITTNVINCLKEELLSTWETYLIPDYHRTVFLDCIYGLTPQQYSPILVKEIEDLQQE